MVIAEVIIMTFLRRFRRLISPRTHFQPIFSQQVAYIRQASKALLQMMRTEDISERKRLEKEVKMCEIQGDAMLTELYEDLYESIVSFMERDHLQTIAMYIDEFLDNINGSAKSILLYKPERIDPQLIELAQYIESEADALKEVITLLIDIKGNFSALTMQCERISELEHAADDSYEEYIGYIFQNEKNPIELMKYKNIAESLETTSDSAKKVSDHVRKILLSCTD